MGSTPILGSLIIRPARSEDSRGILDIYAPIVRDTAISFELQPPALEEIARRIAAAHAWIVAEEGGRVLGYAYAGPFRPREAYRWSVEVTVCVHPDAHRRGVARALYGELFETLRAMGFRQMIAAIALPNPARPRFRDWAALRAACREAAGRPAGPPQLRNRGRAYSGSGPSASSAAWVSSSTRRTTSGGGSWSLRRRRDPGASRPGAFRCGLGPAA